MEGFGIPVLEAMASGTPVIASNATSLPEVGGHAAAYFEPTNMAALAETLFQVLGDQNRQQTMIDLGFAQAQRFHPDIVARRVEIFWGAMACDRT
jgi:alpha-1,3-rhamnosyl/mannosyltransferase